MTRSFEILYRPRGHFRSNQIGAHPTNEVGGVGVFRDHAPFLSWPDARRIDIRATLRDPFEGTHVRRFEKRNAIDVVALIDVSASMAVAHSAAKHRIACDLVEAIAFSSVRIGDRFRAIAGGDSIKFDMPWTRSQACAVSAARSVRALIAEDHGAESFRNVGKNLGVARKLVLMISDFWWPRELLENAFESLSLHDVVPIVLLDTFREGLPDWGFLEVADSERRHRKLIFMRPTLKKRWNEQEVERQRLIGRVAAGRARRPIFLRNGFDPVELSLQLMAV